MAANVTEASINGYGHFAALKDSVDMAKAMAYFENLENATIPLFKISIKVDTLLRKFILEMLT